MESKYLELKERVLKANLRLVELGLVALTWGNVSEIDWVQGAIAIKPSGVTYEDMKVDDIVIVSLNGQVAEGHLKPSSDIPTHLELYKNFPHIGGVVHTYSVYATSFCSSQKKLLLDIGYN